MLASRRATMPTVRDPSRTTRDWLIAMAIAMATFLLFSGVARHDFVNYDDPYYVTENAHVLGGLNVEGVRWAFTTFEDGNWFPLTWISHMADVSVSGVNPGAHHLTNVILHVLSAVFLYGLLRALGFACTPSAIGTLLFALHPLRVESVAWIAERKDVLSGALSLLTLLFYVWYTRHRARSRYLIVLLAFGAALMAKAMAVTLPICMLMVDWVERVRGSERPKIRGSWRVLVLEKAPFFALSLGAAVVAMIAQARAGATTAVDQFGIVARISNALVSYVMYLVDFVWPTGLAVFYPRPETLPVWQPVGAAALLVAITWLAWRERVRAPFLTIGWLWFVVMLVPVIGLVKIGAQARADRYTYLPSVGLSLVVVYGVTQFESRWRQRVSVTRIALVALLVALATTTFVQLKYWTDSVTLFEHARSVTGPNYPVLNNLGEALAAKGEMARAAEVFAEAVNAAPGNAAGRVNLGNALARTGKLDQAAASYREAIRLQPSSAPALAGLGAVLARQGQVDDAIQVLRDAVRLDPSEADAHYNLGNILAGMGRFEEAVASLTEAVRVRPADAMARSNLGAALATVGRYDEAIVQFNEALRIDPGLQQTRANRDRAVELKKRGR